MKPGKEFHSMATDLLNAGMGDVGRLNFILECIAKQKPLYNTDEKYLRQKYSELEAKLETLSGKKKTKTVLPYDDLDNLIDQALDKQEKSRGSASYESKLEKELRTLPKTKKSEFAKSIIIGLSVSLSVGFLAIAVIYWQSI